MSDYDDKNLFDLTERQSRRHAVRTYAPPALASIGALTFAGFKTSGGEGPGGPPGKH